ncbi:MAG: hypothetical protein JEZ10_08250 [Verrucomicrobia bacterium]|nr:hypothetical protein [Verrucomicrobiota bacterium]
MNSMKFNDAIVSIDQLLQYSSYLGLLCGIPDKNINDRFINAAREEAVRVFPNSPLKIIQPPFIKYEDQKILDKKPNAERLPRIACIADLSGPPIKDGNYSCGVLIWWQEDPSFPIDLSVTLAIKELKWVSFASDAHY